MGTLPATFDSTKEESKTPVEFPTDLLCISASNVTSKKIKARKLSPDENLQVYCRRAKRPWHWRDRPSFFEALSRKIDPGSAVTWIRDDEGDCDLMPPKKQKVDIDQSVFSRTRLRACGKQEKVNGVCSGSAPARRWTEAIIDDVDPCSLIGLDCKVFWPMDKVWYKGSIKGYDAEQGLHKIIYTDGDVEELNIGQEQISFYVSRIEIRKLKLKLKPEKEAVVNDEMFVMAVGLNDSDDLDPGDVIWAKLTGHAAWPAIVVDESSISNTKILKSIQGDKGVVVQFFGTYDFARVRPQKTVPFVRGTASGYHLKCKQNRFIQGLDEAQTYICKHKLPDEMLKLLKTANSSNSDTKSEKNSLSDKENKKTMKLSFPLEIGDLSVLSLGNIVQDSMYFQSRKCIFPEGYSAMRNFFSINDPQSTISYKMEVFRNPKAKSRPLFRVTLEDGGRVEGPTPDTCWREIFSRIKKKLNKVRNMVIEEHKFQRTGSQMFGFLNKKVSRLIKALAEGEKFNESSDLPAGYRPIVLSQRDIDRCDVCHMDEEYEDNLFLQCDTCRITVHTKCYGVLQPKDGSLWHCLLCRPPTQPSPVCCLCPVTGGAMKPTTDGRWAHLACAIWIPETCLLDVKKMEPVDGLSRINKDRWKLLCSICGVPYGACIQCSSNSCRVAYHPLCARSHGLCIEPEDVDQSHLMSSEEDDGQSISLLSFCRRHRQLLNKDQTISAEPCATYVPPAKPSGCARCEPYNFFGRRGQREPQVLSAASVKRSFIENTPYLVGGYRQNGLECRPAHFSTGGNMNTLLPNSITSISEKYVHMRSTFSRRLTFGKSRIHGFGVFAKLGHKAGDMVIEYAGEVVRPLIADLREHRTYNSLVGTGSYMFRVDDLRVIDATKAGSIAQLINHSCEPNCYSRVIDVDGDDHIIIFAKRDINEWEELTYDYRFSSIDERLACHCGSSKCRGVVNDIDSEARQSAISVHRSELIPWNGE